MLILLDQTLNIITTKKMFLKKLMACTQNALDEVINFIPMFFVCVQNL